MPKRIVPEQTDPVGPSLSVMQFCQKHGISRAFFYKLSKEGKGPKLTKLGGRTIITQPNEAAFIMSL
jgi:predicted DNA-binding transcriptional regulator AlpA